MYESWDEIYSGQKDEPILGIFSGDNEIPPIESVETEEQAEQIETSTRIFTRQRLFGVLQRLVEVVDQILGGFDSD